MDNPEGHDKKFKGTPQHEAPKPDLSEKQMHQSEGNKFGGMDHPKGPDKEIRRAPHHEAPKHHQSRKHKNQFEGDIKHMDHPEGPDQKFKGEPQHQTPEFDHSKKKNHQLEGVVDHPKSPNQKFKGPLTPKHGESRKQENQVEGEDEYIDDPEGPNQKFKGVPQQQTLESDQSDREAGFTDHSIEPKPTFKDAPQYEATEPDQSKKQSEVDYMNSPKDSVDESEKPVTQSEAKSIPNPATKSADDKGKQNLQTTDKEVPPMLGAQKETTEGEDEINSTGLERTENKKPEDSSSHLTATSQDQGKGEIAPLKKHFWSNWPVIGDGLKASIPKQPKTDFPDEKQQEHIEVKVDEDNKQPAAEVVPAETTSSESSVAASTKTLEILKSVVYGGLIESLTSLSVVTSAASADATTLNIVALSMANLIGGLFILGHNLEELKSEQVDRYIELLGQKDNFILHAFIAVISFLVFGLVPPVVYGFSFGESGDKDFKLAAVAAASILCITLLSIAKAYIKRPSSYLTYFKTVLYYISTGAVASVLSYIAGDLVKELIEKLGWFDSASNFSLMIPGDRHSTTQRGSY
ncbi:involucrin [Vigna radiata var. radiata]|uniref:Involucrin n=1 Tax=Vigna radiata var. radiata TaxID=3916 RepID=A0A1S3VCM0_VIGRR|nr:involucrin [Vigna radiata var. radiata]